MVKFGDEIHSRLLPEHIKHAIDYDGLKGIIRQIIELQAIISGEEVFPEFTEEPAKTDGLVEYKEEELRPLVRTLSVEKDDGKTLEEKIKDLEEK